MMRAQDQQGEPDPAHFERFCIEVIPEMLTTWEASDELARRVGEDILIRAESFAALSQEIRDVLIAPFVEEVAYYKPQSTPLALRGAVAVIIRSSLLEEAHANGPVNAGGIEGITSTAAASLSHFLAARRRNPDPPENNLFAGLPTAYPRAWACLTAVTHAFAKGGRWPYQAPGAPVPALPVAEADEARRTEDRKAVILSGIDPRFDQQMVQLMQEGSDEGGLVWPVASLSRISRNLDKLFQAMEYLLAHGMPILTSNYLLRTADVWVRRGRLVAVDRDNSLAAWQDTSGLSGAHRAVAAEIATIWAKQQDGS